MTREDHDPRPAAVDSHVARIVANAGDIERLLPVLPVGVPVDDGCSTCNARPGQPCKPICSTLQRPRGAGRSAGVSRPTEHDLTAWETQQRRHADDLADLVVGRRPAHSRDGEPDEPWVYAVGLAQLLGAGPARPDRLRQAVTSVRHHPPSDERWRAGVLHLTGVLVEAAGDIQDGWHLLWRDRWRTDGRGRQVLDEHLDAEATTRQGHLRQLETRIHRLRDRVANRGPRLCDCGCRRPAPPPGEGATRPDCRKREERHRKATG